MWLILFPASVFANCLPDFAKIQTEYQDYLENTRPKTQILILPFVENAVKHSETWLKEGLPLLITNAHSDNSSLVSYSYKYKPDTSLKSSDPIIQQIAKDFNVTHVLTGQFQVLSDLTLRINLSLYSSHKPEQIYWHEIISSRDDLLINNIIKGSNVLLGEAGIKGALQSGDIASYVGFKEWVHAENLLHDYKISAIEGAITHLQTALIETHYKFDLAHLLMIQALNMQAFINIWQKHPQNYLFDQAKTHLKYLDLKKYLWYQQRAMRFFKAYELLSQPKSLPLNPKFLKSVFEFIPESPKESACY